MNWKEMLIDSSGLSNVLLSARWWDININVLKMMLAIRTRLVLVRMLLILQHLLQEKRWLQSEVLHSVLRIEFRSSAWEYIQGNFEGGLFSVGHC
jgi:hypothetical protein